MEKTPSQINQELLSKLDKSINILKHILKAHPMLFGKPKEKVNEKLREAYTYRSKLEKFGFIEPTIDLIKAELLIEFIDYMQLGIAISLDLFMQAQNPFYNDSEPITNIDDME